MNSLLLALRQKANALPLSAGVYLMKDARDKIIYVGKSKALKNRVSQYFQEGARHNVKTAQMVSSVASFDYMLTDTEMEALTLENRLIKLHQPKFNICLKDGKSYPYLKLTMSDPYPTIQIVRKRSRDNALYFGPYSGSSVANALLQTAERIFRIPTCKHRFPRDIGKVRPCIYAQMNQCMAPCNQSVTQEEYREVFREVALFLKGSYQSVAQLLTEKMEFAAENLRFEVAAQYRDRIASLNRLRQRQKIVAAPTTQQDVFALYTDDISSCLGVYKIRDGSVIDSCNYYFGAQSLTDSDSLCAFLAELYTNQEYIPSQILFGFPLEEEQRELLTTFLCEKAQRKITLRFPQKGQGKALCDMVFRDAQDHAHHDQAKAERDNDTLVRLATLLQLEVVPEHIESFDISNFGSEQITAGMVVLKNGRFSKKDYRIFSIRSLSEPDDYAAMRQAMERRLAHTEAPYPDLFLLDGGKGHVSVIENLLREKGISIPVFGMVKDSHHKTRALVDSTNEIGIAFDTSIFSMIYRLQEEVHRFTITKMKQAKQKKLTTYYLTQIRGIGPAKAKSLLLHFSSFEALKRATEQQLCAIVGITEQNARDIVSFFEQKDAP